MQTFQLKNNSKSEWTEWFIGLNSDASILNGPDYKAAISDIETHIMSTIPKETTEYYDAFLKKYASYTPKTVHSTGQPWGALEEMKNKKSLASGLLFTIPENPDNEKYKEAVAWVELLTTGSFSENTLSRLPVSYQVCAIIIVVRTHCILIHIHPTPSFY